MRHSNPSAELAMFMVSPLLLLRYGVGNVHCSTDHENSEDFHSLLDFKKDITDDPNGALSNWTSKTHFCPWNGVTCTLRPPSCVKELILPGQNLAGQISPSLGNLTCLNLLDLSTNNFHGLGLYENNLTGVIPPRIGLLTKLEELLLYGNNLYGVIPPGIGNITCLSIIDLLENQLDGAIPSKNNLTGGIPRTPSNLSSLLELSLAFNNLGNTLPSSFGNAIPNLQNLYLGYNSFEGHIPASLGNASGLTDLVLSANNIMGQIPNIFGKLSGLCLLNLEQNMLEARDSAGWEFFDALTNCSSLSELALDANNLQGVIPTSIANLSTNLTYLLLSENHLYGIVPSSIGKLNGLISLSLGYNSFTATIGEWVGKLTNLQNLILTDNYFVARETFSL
ncbi:hypothetical protein BS78_K128000 [Paspalum vaginatum]|uniref:Leucine-rich repeat-containing N-terminal plant-type domain-containing protein n=1 Tax=Paspalum vaginatum TaxID=158149 RepID=A0A9W7X9Q0_9POAL|nr:hypothetical protein BS78_K128000 [Paspalum vaginatum]